MRRALAPLVVLALTLLGAGGCDRGAGGDGGEGGGLEPTATPADAGWFTDVTAAAEIRFDHHRASASRLWLPEIMSGGACWLDYDGDGYLDLYLVQGADLTPAGSSATAPANVLYRNRGDGRFEDVTARTGVGDPGHGMGCAVADWDGDGDPDLLVTNLGRNRLYRNAGDRFVEVSAELGLTAEDWSTSAAFFDYDRDGDLDLYVVNYIRWSAGIEPGCSDYCSPKSYDAPAVDTLYRNDGEGGFTDVSRAAGLDAARGNGLGLAVADLDADGDLDVFVANDGTANQLWLNNGAGGFVDRALGAGCAVNSYGAAEAGMGVAIADLDRDGALDLFLTHLDGETNTLYLNLGDGMFEERTSQSGLAVESLPYTSFGTGFVDFDNDGWVDLFIANGRVMKGGRSHGVDPYAEPDQLFRGTADGGFESIGLNVGEIGSGRAAAFADYDNDGDVDVVVVNNGGSARLLRSDVGQRGGWIQLDLREADGSRALGARVVARAGTAAGQWRLAHPASSYCASNDPRVHFGLGEGVTTAEVDVVWADGTTESFGRLPAGSVHVLRRRAP